MHRIRAKANAYHFFCLLPKGRPKEEDGDAEEREKRKEVGVGIGGFIPICPFSLIFSVCTNREILIFAFR
jgi:hypothetical protein